MGLNSDPRRGVRSAVGAVDDQLADVARVLEAVLGDRIVGMYLYGSAVQGGLRPASDLDVFVVVDDSLEDDQRVALISSLSDVSLSHGRLQSRRPVEVTVARRGSLVPWSGSPLREFQWGEWLRADFDHGYISPAVVDDDLAPLIATVLTASRPLVGPEAADLLVPVPHGLLVGAMQAGAVGLLDELVSDTTNVLLTLCRMLFTALTGQVVPKDVAAEWTLREVGPPGADQLILSCDAYVHGWVSESYDMERVQTLATDLADRIARLPSVD